MELGASAGSRLGGAMLPYRPNCDIFLGTALHASGQAVLPKDEEVCWGGLGLSCSLLESFLPGLNAVGWRNGR